MPLAKAISVTPSYNLYILKMNFETYNNFLQYGSFERIYPRKAVYRLYFCKLSHKGRLLKMMPLYECFFFNITKVYSKNLFHANASQFENVFDALYNPEKCWNDNLLSVEKAYKRPQVNPRYIDPRV